jgi:hypothetical protein
MTHAEVRARLGDYMEGDLPLARRALVDAHLESCTECATRLQQLRITVDAVRALENPEPPPQLAAAVLARIAAGEGRPNTLERFAARFSWLASGRRATPAIAAAAAAVLLVWLYAPRQGPVAVPPLQDQLSQQGDLIGASAADPAGPAAAPARGADEAAAQRDDFERARRDPDWLLQTVAAQGEPGRSAWLAALARQAGSHEELMELAQKLRQLPGEEASRLADTLTDLAAQLDSR